MPFNLRARLECERSDESVWRGSYGTKADKSRQAECPRRQGGADFRHGPRMEVEGEAAGDDDPHVPESLAIERGADVPDELRVHAGGLEGAHLRDDGLVDHVLRR